MARKQQASGVVEAISKKQVKTRKGNSPVYSFLIDDEWYRTNFTKPPFEEGDEIEFDYVVGDYGNDVDVDSVEIVTEGGGAEAEAEVERPAKRSNAEPKAKPKAATAGRTVGGKDDYWAAKDAHDKEKELVIRYLAARNSAITFVDMLVKHGAVVVGTTKASKAKATLLLEELVNKYAADFYLGAAYDKVVAIKPVKLRSMPVDEEGEEEASEPEDANAEAGDD